MQGEAGVIVPPDGYLREARRLCTAHGVLLIADEIQSGLGRTGAPSPATTRASCPDLYVLGKALGGGIVALSAVVADDDVLGVFGPGSHGSTFGGNPLACAVGRAVLELLATGEPQANAARVGARLRAGLDAAAPLPALASDPLARAVVRPRPRARRADRAGRLRALLRRGRAREGHARAHDPARAAADDHRGGGGLAARAAARGARRRPCRRVHAASFASIDDLDRHIVAELLEDGRVEPRRARRAREPLLAGGQAARRPAALRPA